MTGFGIRALKRLKEESSYLNQNNQKYYPHIVVGDDFLAVWKFLKLTKEHGEENVCLISENRLDKETLLEQWRCSIHTLRSEEGARALIGMMPQLEITPTKSKVKFYKDTKLHEFGGRAKSLPFAEGESDFTSPFYKVNYQNLFTSEDWDDLDSLIAKGQVNKILKSVELATPQDLVEKTFFKLHTGEHESFECEKLHWMINPKKFYKLIDDKVSISDTVSEYCTHLETQTGVVVHFECDRKIYDEEGTIFLPQSMTHDWGHFIVDFENFDHEKKQQNFTGLILLKDEDLTEEELAKKIKLLKRVLERVFPEFANSSYTEHIRFAQDMFIRSMQDNLKASMEQEMPQLEFSGVAAPLSENNSQLFSTGRGILSLSS